MRSSVVACRERHRRSTVAISERAGNGRCGGKCRGDTGNNFEADAGLAQRSHLFRRAAEDERIAALEPHHASAIARVLDHQRVDLFLSNILDSTALAHVYHLGIPPEVEN